MPACVALRVTAPGPVNVSVLPSTPSVAGPETTVIVTGNPELAVAVNTSGEAVIATAVDVVGRVKLIVWAIFGTRTPWFREVVAAWVRAAPRMIESMLIKTRHKQFVFMVNKTIGGCSGVF